MDLATGGVVIDGVADRRICTGRASYSQGDIAQRLNACALSPAARETADRYRSRDRSVNFGDWKETPMLASTNAFAFMGCCRRQSLRFMSVCLAIASCGPAHGAAVLVSDLRRIEASAYASAGGVANTDMKSDQATFGENPFDSSVNAGASVPGQFASGSAATTQRTEFISAPAGFSKFAGSGSLTILNIPETSDGGGTIHNLVDVTFHLDFSEPFQLTGGLPSLAGSGGVNQSTTSVSLAMVGSIPFLAALRAAIMRLGAFWQPETTDSCIKSTLRRSIPAPLAITTSRYRLGSPSHRTSRSQSLYSLLGVSRSLSDASCSKYKRQVIAFQ